MRHLQRTHLTILLGFCLFFPLAWMENSHSFAVETPCLSTFVNEPSCSSNALTHEIRNEFACQPDSFQAAGLILGKPIPEMSVFDEEGQEFSMNGNKPHYTVYVFACNTCQPFLNKVDNIERVATEFSKENVRFYYVNKEVVHPELRNLVDAYTLRERRMLVNQFQIELETKIPWLVDGPKQVLKNTMGLNYPNFELVVDPKGRLVHFSEWAQPSEIRAFLRTVFPLKKNAAPPKTDDDFFDKQPSRFKAENRPEGAAPSHRADKPQFMPRLVVIPDLPDPNKDYFLKLRAEVQRPVLKGKPGKLYLRFDVDPLYGVSWKDDSTSLRMRIYSQKQPKEPLVDWPKNRQSADHLQGQAPLEILIDSPAASLGEIDVLISYEMVSKKGEKVSAEQRFKVRFVEAGD